MGPLMLYRKETPHPRDPLSRGVDYDRQLDSLRLDEESEALRWAQLLSFLLSWVAFRSARLWKASTPGRLLVVEQNFAPRVRVVRIVAVVLVVVVVVFGKVGQVPASPPLLNNSSSALKTFPLHNHPGGHTIAALEHYYLKMKNMSKYTNVSNFKFKYK